MLEKPMLKTHTPGVSLPIDWNTTWAAIWRAHREALRPVRRIAPVQLDDLIGVDDQKAALVRNTERFLNGQPANNVLLWGSRGTGKSSLIKALLNHLAPRGLRLIEVDKADLVYLPEIVDLISEQPFQYILFCDDLSFEADEPTYKALKTVLEGSIEMPPENVLIYATSNRRHLMPEYMEENQQARVVKTELHHAEAVEEKIALSDRFGLWLSFYPINQEVYLAMVDACFRRWQGDREELHRQAIRFALQRGGRSGRAAFQFYKHLAE
jgi:predicted AAA+ superfamily ATPase